MLNLIFSLVLIKLALTVVLFSTSVHLEMRTLCGQSFRLFSCNRLNWVCNLQPSRNVNHSPSSYTSNVASMFRCCFFSALTQSSSTWFRLPSCTYYPCEAPFIWRKLVSGHPSRRVKFSERLYEKNNDPFSRIKSRPRIFCSSSLDRVDPAG